MASKFLNRRALFALLVLICVFSSLGVIVGSHWSSVTIGSGGTVNTFGVGVYKDIDCSMAVDFLDWGNLEPGSIKNNTIYVRNEGSLDAALFMTVDNWNPPSASSYMSLSWNCDGKMLEPMETAVATLTLQVSPSVTGINGFSIGIIIGASD